MIKLSRPFWVLFTLTFLLLLVVYAPASLVSSVLSQTSDNMLVLANAEGTLWQGTGTPAIRRRKGGYLPLQAVHWKLSPLALFSGKLLVQFTRDDAPSLPAMELSISPRQIDIRNLSLTVPPDITGELLPLLQPLQLSGQFLVNSPALSFSGNTISGTATATWSRAGSALSRVNPLGNYQLTLTGNGSGIDLTLMTMSGALLMSGQGNWSQASGFRFNAEAQATLESQDKLAELMVYLGPESRPGVRAINLTQLAR